MHDLGGMQGFGPVVRERDEPVFHHDWERRVFGLNFSAIPHNVDQFRHAIERMHPVAYLQASYYEKWLHAIEHDALAAGSISRHDLDTWAARVAKDGLAAVPRREDPASAAALAAAIRTPAVAPEPACGRFEAGDQVRVRRVAPTGHTRCPRYVRGVGGRVERCWGHHPLPDAGALGERRSEPLYTVTLTATDIWGSGDHTVLLDLWESYLEPEGANG